MALNIDIEKLVYEDFMKGVQMGKFISTEVLKL